MGRFFTNLFVFGIFNCIALILITSVMIGMPNHVTPSEFWQEGQFFTLGTLAVFNGGAIACVLFGYEKTEIGVQN